jgi:hypothetical protein
LNSLSPQFVLVAEDVLSCPKNVPLDPVTHLGDKNQQMSGLAKKVAVAGASGGLFLF